MTKSLTRATYLQQDLVREFVDSDNEQERFQVVGELVGVGRIAELRQGLENSRNNWSRATNTIEREVAPLRSQLLAISERIARLGAMDADVSTEQAFRTWIDEAAQFVPADGLERLLSGRSAQSLDRALTGLHARQLAEERVVSAAHRLLAHINRPAEVAPDPLPLEEAERQALAGYEEASVALATGQQQAAQQRREQVEQAERDASLRTLAELALPHLGERCPVCNQTYDGAATRARLTKLVADHGSGREARVPIDAVQQAAVGVEGAERRLAVARAELRAARSRAEHRTQWEQSLLQLASDVGIDPGEDLRRRAEERLAEARKVASAVSHLRGEGERLSIQLARSAELAQRSGLEQQAANLRHDLEGRERDLASRRETGELASSLLDRLREVNANLVATELKESSRFSSAYTRKSIRTRRSAP